MAGITTAFGAEPDVNGTPKPKRANRKCPECGAGRHTSASTCSLYKGPRESSRSRPDTAPRRTPLKPQVVAQNVGVCISLAQSAIFTMRPDLIEDQLSPQELGELSYALADELLSHETIVRWINRAAGAGVHIRLAVVVVGIAIPRMVRHGMLPPAAAMGMLGAMVGEDGMSQERANQVNTMHAAEASLGPWATTDGVAEADTVLPFRSDPGA